MTANLLHSRSWLILVALSLLAVPDGSCVAAAGDLVFSRVAELPVECRDGAGRLQMVTEQVGWLRSARTLWETRDGGTHWAERKLPKTTFIADYARVQFVDDGHGWMFWVAPEALYETADGGVTWMRKSLPGLNGDIHAAWLLPDRDLAWVAGGVYKWSARPDAPNYALERYESGGWGILHPIVFSQKGSSGPWRAHELPPISFFIGDLRFWDDKHGYAVGDVGFYYTDNGGESWTAAKFREGPGSEPPKDDTEQGQHAVLFFLDRNNGWMSLDNRSLYRTKDGGKNWLRIASGDIPYFDNLQFLSPTYGLAIAHRSELYESIDGGVTWRKVKTPFRPRALESLGGRSGWVLSDSELYRFSLDSEGTGSEPSGTAPKTP